ncbi:MAG: hypothetical protein AAF183_24585 [Pseudomonadota bacterium]
MKKEDSRQALRKSNGGWTPKLLALTDAIGTLLRFVMLPSNRYDTGSVARAIHGLSFDALLVDKAVNRTWIVAEMNERGAMS